MKYYSRKETIDTMTKYERKTIERLRKIEILKKIPLNEWTSWELYDLIFDYEIYFLICNSNNDKPVSIYKYLYSGIYEKKSVYEDLKSDVLKSDIFESKNVKSIKLQKFNS